MSVDLQRDPETYAIIGAAMAVHRELGHGFLEAVYNEALEIEFNNRYIPNKKEVSLPICYGEHQLKAHYRADFVCHDSIIIEIKVLAETNGTEEAQVINHLKASGYERALLINFGRPSLQYKRLILSNNTQQNNL